MIVSVICSCAQMLILFPWAEDSELEVRPGSALCDQRRIRIHCVGHGEVLTEPEEAQLRSALGMAASTSASVPAAVMP